MPLSEIMTSKEFPIPAIAADNSAIAAWHVHILKNGLNLSGIGQTLALSVSNFVANPLRFKKRFKEDRQDVFPAFGIPQNSMTIGRLGRDVFFRSKMVDASRSSSFMGMRSV